MTNDGGGWGWGWGGAAGVGVSDFFFFAKFPTLKFEGGWVRGG